MQKFDQATCRGGVAPAVEEGGLLMDNNDSLFSSNEKKRKRKAYSGGMSGIAVAYQEACISDRTFQQDEEKNSDDGNSDGMVCRENLNNILRKKPKSNPFLQQQLQRQQQ